MRHHKQFIVAVIVFVLILIAAFHYFPLRIPGFGTPSGTTTSTTVQGEREPFFAAPHFPDSLSVAGGGGGASTPAQRSPTTTAAANAEEQNPTTSMPIPAGFTPQQISPYFGKVRFSSVSTWQISLSASFQTATGSIQTADVTGWRIQGNRGAIYIPQAVSIYDPSGLTAQSDIFMKNGNALYMYANGSSPLGVNFRVNKCLGYLPAMHSNQFSISYGGCPYPNQSEISSFTGRCQNFIRSLGSCQVPDLSSLTLQNDYQCQEFLSHLNYAGCFARHRGDADFSGQYIYAWTGQSSLDAAHDRVYLYDTKGLLVDKYEY